MNRTVEGGSLAVFAKAVQLILVSRSALSAIWIPTHRRIVIYADRSYSSSVTSSGDSRPSSTSWLDIAVVVVVAVVTNAAGVAAQAAWDLPWDPAGQPTASVVSRQRLALAQHHARDVRLLLDKLAAQTAQERVDSAVSAVKLRSAIGEEAVSLQASVREKERLITYLQDEAAQAARASVDADHQVAEETEAVAESLEAAQRHLGLVVAADRILYGVAAWTIIAVIILTIVRRRSVLHRGTVLFGGLAGFVVVRAVSELGWLVTAAALAVVALVWICRPVSAHG